MRKDYLIPLAILVGFILHAFIMTTFEKPTAGQICIENIKKSDAYKKIKKHTKKARYVMMMCGPSN